MKPRIFVGTLHHGEGDFESCVDAIKRQKDVEVTHLVISDLKEKEAHNKLWSAWNDAKVSHDIFVKVDADTVLSSAHVLRTIYDHLQTNPEATGLQAPLHDYMTYGLINGLNAYTKKVEFTATSEDLYCDRGMETGNNLVLRDPLPGELLPAGFHCHLATPLQAFRYGVHRMLKGQRENIYSVTHAFDRDRDTLRGYALIGVLMIDRFLDSKKVDYQDAELQASFSGSHVAVL